MAKKTKKEKKKEEAELIRIRRDRINVLLPPLINFFTSEVGQTILWWQLSKRNKILDATNKFIVGKEVVEFAAGFVPTSNVEFMDLPPAIQLGALIQEIEDGAELLSKLKIPDIKGVVQDVVVDPVVEAVTGAGETIAESGYEAGSSDIVRDIEEGLRFYIKYGELPDQIKEKYGFW